MKIVTDNAAILTVTDATHKLKRSNGNTKSQISTKSTIMKEKRKPIKKVRWADQVKPKMTTKEKICETFYCSLFENGFVFRLFMCRVQKGL